MYISFLMPQKSGVMPLSPLTKRPIFMISECRELALMVVIWGDSALALLE